VSAHDTGRASGTQFNRLRSRPSPDDLDVLELDAGRQRFGCVALPEGGPSMGGCLSPNLEEPMSEPTKEELMARIAELEKKAEGRKKGALEFRVGEKGGVSVYGLGRFPVTLYYEQWVRLLDMAKDLREFLEENKHRLKLKEQ
jgi:hypothetical protein